MSDSTPTVTLNVTDIADMVKCLDHAAEQGAFRGWNNIRQVLALRDRVHAFVLSTTASLNNTESALAEADSSDGSPSSEDAAGSTEG